MKGATTCKLFAALALALAAHAEITALAEEPSAPSGLAAPLADELDSLSHSELLARATKAWKAKAGTLARTLCDAALTTTTAGGKTGAYSPRKAKNDSNHGTTGHANTVNKLLGTAWCEKALDVPSSCKKGCAEHFCTECKEGAGIMITRHLKMSGKCEPYSETSPKTTCAKLDANMNAAATEPNTICTVVSLDKTISTFSSTTFNKISNLKFKTKKGTFELIAVPKCYIRKETICQSGSCTVKKQARCKEICKLKKWEDISSESCSTSACTTVGGEACRDIVRMA